MKTIFKLSLVMLGVVPLVALAQPTKPPAAKTPAAAPAQAAGVDNGVFTIRGGVTTYDSERGVGHMTKDVVITQTGEDVVMHAQDATFDKNRNVANASVQLSVQTRDSTIRGTKLFADFNERTATITGNVIINSHGKNDGVAASLSSETQKKPIKVTCDRVDWDYDIRQATATGNIQIYQGVNHGTCNKIIYDEKRNIVNLLGDVRFVDDKDSTLLGQDITIYLEEGRVSSTDPIRLVAKSRGNLNPPTTPKNQKAPKVGKNFAPAPTLPADLVGDGPPPPVPAARPTATEEPIPTVVPDDAGEAPVTAPATP